MDAATREQKIQAAATAVGQARTSPNAANDRNLADKLVEAAVYDAGWQHVLAEQQRAGQQKGADEQQRANDAQTRERERQERASKPWLYQ